MAFDFITQMTLSLFLPMLMNTKLECKYHQIYSKMLRKICKMEVCSQFHQSQKKSVDQHFISIYGPNLCKNYLVAISCFPLRTSHR